MLTQELKDLLRNAPDDQVVVFYETEDADNGDHQISYGIDAVRFDPAPGGFLRLISLPDNT